MSVLNSNPSFETDSSGWSASGGTIARSTAQAHGGLASLLLTPDGASGIAEVTTTPYMSVVAGNQYLMSVWVRCAVARNVDVFTVWSNGSIETGDSRVTTAVAANTWTLIETFVTAPVGAVQARLAVSLTASPLASHLLYIDDAYFETAESAAIGVVASYNESFHSPGFDITVSGLSGYNTLTVTRVDLSGEDPDTPVRGADGVPISGSTFAVSDYEAPVGKNVIYKATARSSQAADTFTRTVASGWGVATFGEAWTVVGTNVHSVNGSAGAVAIAARATSYFTTISDNLSDAEIRAKVTVPASGIPTGGPMDVGVILRWLDSANYFLAQLRFHVGGSVELQLIRVASGVGTLFGSAPLPGTATAGSAWYVKLQTAGVTMAGKGWLATDPEPGDWQAVGDTSSVASGKAGVRARVESTNTNALPYTPLVDDIQITGLGGTSVLASTGTSSSTGVQDGFGRSATSGWGSPEIGAPWVVRSGPIGDFSVASGVGRMAMTQRSVSGSFGTEYVVETPLSHTDIDQKVRVRALAAPTGDTLRFSLMARETDRDNWWEMEFAFKTDGTSQVRLARELLGTAQFTDPVVTAPTFTPGAWYWMRFQCVGTQLRGRVWLDGTTEPTGWNIETTSTLHPSGSFVGVKAFSSAFSTNPTPQIVEFDDYSLTILDSTTMIPYTDPGTSWLKSVGQPALSRRINLSQWTETSQPGRILGEYEVLGRRNKVVLRDVLGGREGTLVLATFRMGAVWEADCSFRDLQNLLELGGTMLVQTTGVDSTGEHDMYFEIRDIKRSRVGVVGGDFAHLFELSFVEVDRPATDQEALTLRNWQDVIDQNANWQSVLDNHSTWLDVLQQNL